MTDEWEGGVADALAELRLLHAAGDREGVELWAASHSHLAERRDRRILKVLTREIAHEYLLLPHTASFFGLEVTEQATEADRLCGQLIVASINGDDDSCEALLDAAATWSLAARGALMRAVVSVAGFAVDRSL